MANLGPNLGVRGIFSASETASRPWQMLAWVAEQQQARPDLQIVGGAMPLTDLQRLGASLGSGGGDGGGGRGRRPPGYSTQQNASELLRGASVVVVVRHPLFQAIADLTAPGTGGGSGRADGRRLLRMDSGGGSGGAGDAMVSRRQQGTAAADAAAINITTTNTRQKRCAGQQRRLAVARRGARGPTAPLAAKVSQRSAALAPGLTPHGPLIQIPQRGVS